MTLDESELVAEQPVNLTASGFRPRSLVVAELHSEPVEVGRATTDQDGTVELSIRIPDVEEGRHHLVLSGTDALGDKVVIREPVTVGRDTVAPSLVDIKLSHSTVDVTNGPVDVTVTVRATDDMTGLDGVCAMWIGEDDSTGAQASTGSCNWTWNGTLTLASGTSKDGTWVGSFTVPAGVAPQKMAFYEWVLSDKAGNEVRSREGGPAFTIVNKG
jgi:hypothetical protein